MNEKRGAGMPERRAWSPREVAKVIGVSPATVYRAIRAGDLYARQWGERYIIPTEAIQAFLEGRPYSPDGPVPAKRPKTPPSSSKRPSNNRGWPHSEFAPSAVSSNGDQPLTEATGQRIADLLEELNGHLARS